ncbi:EamA family transporter [Candidatus Poribacteria bacterium]|nr:EamA family transporter [Candidatus Poribacteria bacterium]
MKDMLLIILSVSLASVAQMLLKLGMMKVGKVSSLSSAPSMLISALINPLVISGLAVFGVSALSWLVVLSRVKLSIAYPMVSLGYVAVVLFSWLIFKETIRPVTIIGCIFVGIGVFLISRGIN